MLTHHALTINNGVMDFTSRDNAMKTATANNTIKASAATAIFRIAYVFGHIAFVTWAVVPPILWMAHIQSHSRPTTEWAAALYLVATIASIVALVRGRRFIGRALRLGNRSAGWSGVFCMALILAAPLLPLFLLAYAQASSPSAAPAKSHLDELLFDVEYMKVPGNIFNMDR